MSWGRFNYARGVLDSGSLPDPLESRSKWATIQAIRRRKGLAPYRRGGTSKSNSKSKKSGRRPLRYCSDSDSDFENEYEESPKQKEKRLKTKSDTKSKPVDEEKVGNSPEDRLFQSSYDFYTMTPFHYSKVDNSIEPVFFVNRRKRGKDSKVISLKEMCILKIVKNCHSLNSNHLTYLPWKNNWERIWNYILYYNLDSFKLFKLFYNGFHNELSFKCHLVDNGTGGGDSSYGEMYVGNKQRERYIFEKLLSINKHRVETFAKNINFQTLINGMNKFSSINENNIIFLNLSNLSNFNRNNELHFLPNLVNLRVLDVSNTSIDEHILKLWCISINSGKWNQLELLILNNNPKIKNIQDLLCLQKGSLKYLEVDYSINNVNKLWSVKKNILELDLNTSIMKKYHILQKLQNNNNNNSNIDSPARDKLCFDIQIVNEIFDRNCSIAEFENKSDYEKFQLVMLENNKLRDIWSLRDKRHSKGYNKFYVKSSIGTTTPITTSPIKVESEQDTTLQDNSPPVSSSSSSSSPSGKVVKKPLKPKKKMTKLNAASFFGLM